jgi:putative ABC transport system permease protein
MSTLLYAITTQSLTFLPLAFGISVSYTLMRATDMTLDGSFVLGASVFSRLVTSGISPEIAGIAAIFAGILAGIMVSVIQRGGKVDSLLAGILATFILASGNLILMGKPNINLLSAHTLMSDAFLKSDTAGWILVSIYSLFFCCLASLFVRSRLGLTLRALGDNPNLLQRLGKNIENYRMLGFAFTNMLAAVSGCLTAQTIGYADIGMGLGMTLTGIGSIILGQQILKIIIRQHVARMKSELFSCLIGVIIYFFAMNLLLRLEINPVYLKMILGLTLILFLRTAVRSQS